MQKFGNKAQTLKSLLSTLSTASIAPLVSFNSADWQSNPLGCINNIRTQLGDKPLIVRSSCAREDTVEFSNAGAFTTLLNVTSDQLVDAVNDVFLSYGKLHPQDEVLIQPMLENVIQSGVAFSHDPNTGSPYRIINWTEGGDTTLVTGGRGGRVWQMAGGSKVQNNSIHTPIILMLEELLELFGATPIDCEFASTFQADVLTLWLLQVRPLILVEDCESEEKQLDRLEQIKRKVNRGMRPHPFLLGSRTVYGVMPDWNPAEIIGIRPKPLALSLYRELVTDSIWAYQRHNYGYRNLRSFMLMPNFFGMPYIDVRVSFNSFIPSDLDEDIGARLVDYYVDTLLSEPSLHDKVEFEIVWSCYTFDLPEKLQVLREKGFSHEEQKDVAESLRTITNSVLHPKRGLPIADLQKVSRLRARRKILSMSNLGPVEKIYWLIEDAKRYGTLPFAGLARAGFMAVQLLKSLVTVGVFTELDYECFLAGISTVSGRMQLDKMNMTKAEFLIRYGHLRPGTYDILSPRYDEAPELYFDWEQAAAESGGPEKYLPTSQQLSEIDSLLRWHKIDVNALELIAFMRSAIEQRELAKFEFTHNLSDALSLITQISARNGISTEDIAFCDYGVFRELQASEIPIKPSLEKNIEQGKARYSETLKISLPPLISRPEDVLAFEWPEMTPSFITSKRVTASVVSIDCGDRLEGSIVCIPNADPGFDWLFSHSIAGLITAWGGTNSHMAIRASEQRLPAVIGVGELLYQNWSRAKSLRIDCGAQRVEVLK